MIAQVKTSTDLGMPDDTAALNDVMYQADDNMGEYYTLTFINNTDHIVYPFLWATNDAEQCSTLIEVDGQKHYACSNYDQQDPTKNPGSIYDPIDPWNEDYRGYIGYTGADGKNYLGIPAGKTATITVPLVFWDAARIYIANDSAYFISPKGTQVPQFNPPINPYNFFWLERDGITPTLRCHQPMPNLPSTSAGLTVVVLWYHCREAFAPTNDAPAQLLEFTLRHPWQQKLNQNLSVDILGPLANYDVSYVDTIYLPVAMEADDFTDSQTAYGWIGASQTEDQFQQAFKDFTSVDPTKNGLGQYFGGNGYTQYYFPATMPSDVGIKLPSGAQAVGDSPFGSHPSSYNIYKYTLVSGGTEDFRVDVNAVSQDSTTLAVTLNPDDAVPNGAEQQNTILNTLNTTPSGILNLICPGHQDLIPDGTQIIKYDPVQQNSTGIATLKPATQLVKGQDYSVSFQRLVTDYVTSAMVNLWYSWTEYYVKNNAYAKNHPNNPPQSYSGNISVPSDSPPSRVLTFEDPLPPVGALVPGMKVTGAGIPGESDGSFCTIADLTLTEDQSSIQSITLSELVSNTSSGSYQFEGPLAIAGTDNAVVHTFDLSFEDVDTALAFSQAVYQAMSAMSTIPQDTGNKAPLPLQILYNVIGCNVGQIPHIGQDLSPRDSRIATEITNKIKSILRGVPDFTDSTKYPENTWYPDPSTATGGCKFNAYNLDPFVWFVHKKLGMSGYGFSVDDDVADVGANNAQNLKIAIGGLNGLPNQNPWVSQ